MSVLMVIPITEVIDQETQSVVALATTDVKAGAMIEALSAMHPDRGYYPDDALPVDQLAF